jgi:molybdenum cofactor biosynthesis protein MoaC
MVGQASGVALQYIVYSPNLRLDHTLFGHGIHRIPTTRPWLSTHAMAPLRRITHHHARPFSTTPSTHQDDPSSTSGRLTHIDPSSGRASRVDISDKQITKRTAKAGASVFLGAETFRLVAAHAMAKGDVLTVAQLAGIQAAKRTADLIPLCHPLQLSRVDVQLTLDETRHAVNIVATVMCTGRTGVEMEALTAASVAALTVFDMCKAASKAIRISDIRVLSKTGGKSGDYVASDAVL